MLYSIPYPFAISKIELVETDSTIVAAVAVAVVLCCRRRCCYSCYCFCRPVVADNAVD